jgi:hypothetical protein
MMAMRTSGSIRFVDEALPIGKQIAQACLAFRRRVDGFTAAVVDKLSAWSASDIEIDALDGAADGDCGGGNERTLFQTLKPLPQCCAITQCLFGGGVCLIVGHVGEQEHAVGRGDDIFNFRTGLGFKKRDGINQYALVWNQQPGLLQFSDGRSRLYAGFQNRARFHICLGWQQRKVVIGLQRGEGHMSIFFYLVDRFSMDVDGIDILSKRVD